MVTIALPKRDSSSSYVGLLFFMATATMLFAGTISALLIRRASSDWTSIFFPPMLLVNTAVILVSSLTLEAARFGLKGKNVFAYRSWMTVTMLLGIVFLVGQVLAWKELTAHGIFVPSNPHASFFYLLTGMHALHLLGGIILLMVASVRAWRSSNVLEETKILTLSRMYWHFLDVLWIYLVVVLFS